MAKLMKKNGFTIIELTIVLVGIGLLIGGVVIGQSLVNGAKANAIIKQYNTFLAATDQFRQTYGQMPGDFNQAVSKIGAPRNGDGDGVVRADAGYMEGADFFYHLSAAELIDLKLVAPANNTGVLINGVDTPKGTIKNTFWTVKNLHGSEGTPNKNSYFGWGPRFAFEDNVDFPNDTYIILSKFAGGFSTQKGVPAEVAMRVDAKIDDKLPNRGKLRGSEDCIDDYAPTSAYQRNRECAMGFIYGR